MKQENKLIESVDFYFENGFMIFTPEYHTNRGYCCGNGCRHCPFDYKNVPELLKQQLLAARNPALK
ncbi:MAG: hypothetical protein JSS98_05900 [Bacteroidetes bacterium]|nr:hypothetical protein [Bacteroidota bacterium]